MPLCSFFFGVVVGIFLNISLACLKDHGPKIFSPSLSSSLPKKNPWVGDIKFFYLLFLIFHEKCRFCRKLISGQFFFVEAITAVLFVMSYYFFGSNFPMLFFSFCFVSFLVLFIISDLKWRLLPHLFNNLFILCGLFFSAYLSNQPFFVPRLFNSAGNIVTIGAMLFGLNRLIPNGMGGGDIKMVAGLAAWLGFLKTLLVLFMASCGGVFLFLVLICGGRINRKFAIPFGPCLSLGALMVWFYPLFLKNLTGLDL